MTTPGTGGSAEVRISLLEGMTVQQPPEYLAPRQGGPMKLVLEKNGRRVGFNDDYLSRHVLFLGGIGTGKSNTMYQFLDQLRRTASGDDVFVVFDTKGDFRERFYRPGDAVLSSTPDQDAGGVIWNLFADLLARDRAERAEQVHEVATTVFSDALSQSEQNKFFAMGARDIFVAVTEAMCRKQESSTSQESFTNDDLRSQLEQDPADLLDLLAEEQNEDLAGTARYLQGEGSTPDSILAFLEQTLSETFAGTFQRPGDFSVRDFVRRKGGRALFVEYDIASGSRLLPVYRVLIDLAIKEALGLGRAGAPGSVYFVLDEFALLPKLSHISNGINFGRSLGLKFLVGTQNVAQVQNAYGPQVANSILSGFGTVLAFRLMDDSSRNLVRQRFGTNRKQISTYAHVRSEGVHQLVITGNVIEDWVLSGLAVGQCVLSLPDGPPYFFAFDEHQPRKPG